MSFILDALKKSEAERRQGEIPALSDHFESPVSRRRPLWPVLLIAALLLNGAVFGAWLLLRKEKTPPVRTSAGELDRIIAAVPRPEPSRGMAMEPPSPARAESRATTQASGAVSAPTEPARPATSTKVPGPAPVVFSTEVNKEISADSVNAAAASSAHGKEAAGSVPSNTAQELLPFETSASATDALGAEPVPLFSELPSEVRSGLPKLNLQLHYFSPEPARRLVRINGFNLREGDRGGDGLTVLEITSDGIRLSCKGVRFFLPASRR